MQEKENSVELRRTCRRVHVSVVFVLCLRVRLSRGACTYV